MLRPFYTRTRESTNERFCAMGSHSLKEISSQTERYLVCLQTDYALVSLTSCFCV